MLLFGLSAKKILHLRSAGEMAEWSNAVVLKTIVPKGTGGSNPSLSAYKKLNLMIELFFIEPLYLDIEEIDACYYFSEIVFCKATILIAVMAASIPLFPCFPPERSMAC